jgi:hypothetical protein
MIERKNIDNLFKEKLDNFEVLPPEESWNIIETRLKEKKKRRIVPFWWKLSGVAALFVVGFFTYNSVTNSNKNNSNTDDNNIVNTEKNNSPEKTNNNTKIVEAENNKPSSIEDNNEKVNANTLENKINNDTENSSSNYKETIVLSNSDENKSNNNITSKKESLKSKSNQKESNLNNINSDNENNTITNSEKNKTQIAQNNSNTKSKTKNQSYINKENNIGNDKIAMKSQTTENVLKTNSTENNAITHNQNSTNEFENVKNHTDIDTKGDLIKKIDSTQIASVEPNALEELQNEKEKKIVTEQKINRWQVTPNLAPVYFSSLSNGSPLDEKFAENTKQYNTNLSFGVAASYALNKKLKIRTGINALNVEYNTTDIMFSQTQSASRTLKNVDPNLQGSLIDIEPIKNVNTNFGRIGNDRFDGVLNQKLGYIEVPVELSYKLISKKIGVDLIGGLSSMILNKNEVYLEADGLYMNIGEASNLNKIHFSSNIGLGFNYNFFKNFDAKVEPVFKYQINTFSNDAGNFKPYIFGVYSGISYTF